MKIALLQIAPTSSLSANKEKGVSACKKAKEAGAEIALFPEMWSNGYRIYDREFPESARILMLKGAEFDLEMMRDYRSREVHGNAFRRPEKYGILLDPSVKDPFVRNKRGNS